MTLSPQKTILKDHVAMIPSAWEPSRRGQHLTFIKQLLPKWSLSMTSISTTKLEFSLEMPLFIDANDITEIICNILDTPLKSYTVSIETKSTSTCHHDSKLNRVRRVWNFEFEHVFGGSIYHHIFHKIDNKFNFDINTPTADE